MYLSQARPVHVQIDFVDGVPRAGKAPGSSSACPRCSLHATPCSLPGDFGFDPLGLMDPEGAGSFIDPKWLPYAELINGRWAMLGASGMIAPEILGAAGAIPSETGLVWFKSGVIPPGLCTTTGPTPTLCSCWRSSSWPSLSTAGRRTTTVSTLRP